MKETTLGEFVANGGFWARVQGLSPFPFFDTYPPENLDAVMVLKYGERIILPKLVDVNKDQLAAMVVDLFSDKWDKLISIHAANLDLFAISAKHLTENLEKVGESTKTQENTNKVSAYNEADLIADSGADNSEETADSETATRTVTDSQRGYNSAYRNLDTSQKMAIISLITLDVVNTISLTVY